MKTITASDANRHFSRVLREVQEGEVFLVVSRGKPVATIGAVKPGVEERRAARDALMERLRRQAVTGARSWTRDDLYED